MTVTKHGPVQGLRYTSRGEGLPTSPGNHTQLREGAALPTPALASENPGEVGGGRVRGTEPTGSTQTSRGRGVGEEEDLSCCDVQAAQAARDNAAFDGSEDLVPPTPSPCPGRGLPSSVETGTQHSPALVPPRNLVPRDFEIIIECPLRQSTLRTEDTQTSEDSNSNRNGSNPETGKSVPESEDGHASGQEGVSARRSSRAASVTISVTHSQDASPSQAQGPRRGSSDGHVEDRRGSSDGHVEDRSGGHRHSNAGSILRWRAEDTDKEGSPGAAGLQDGGGRGAAEAGEDNCSISGCHGYQNQALEVEEDAWKTVRTPKSRKSMALPTSSVGSRTSRTVLVLACLVTQTLMTAFVFGMPTVLLDLMDTFQASRAQAGFIQAVNFVCLGVFGLVFSELCEKFGCGKTMGVSAVLVCAGAVGCAFSTSYATFMVALFVTYTFNVAAFTIPLIMLGRVFGAEGGGPISVASLGPGLASVLFPWLGLVLAQTYSWRGFFLVTGALYLHCLPVALFCHLHFELPLNRHMPQYRGGRRPSMLVRGRSLARDAQYLGLLVCIFATLVALPTAIFFFTDIAAEKGVDKESASYLISLFGLTSLGGRAVVALIKYFVRFQSIRVFVSLLLVCGGLVLVLPWLSGYTALLALMVVFGFCFGATSVGFPASCLETCGENYSVGIGGSNIATAVGSLVISPLAGWLKDVTGGYDAMLYCLVAMTLSAGSLLAAILLWRACCGSRQKQQGD